VYWWSARCCDQTGPLLFRGACLFEHHFTTQASLGIWQHGPPVTWLFDNMAWVWLEGPAILLGLTFPVTAVAVGVDGEGSG
jgi:hypothetical protein